MMGSSVNYAVKGYGLLGATGDWAKLIASSIASSSSSSSSSSSDKINCRDYDLTKYTCRARESWTTETETVKAAGNVTITVGLTKYTLGLSYGVGLEEITIVIKTPACVNDESNLCDKSHVINNKPAFSSKDAAVSLQ